MSETMSIRTRNAGEMIAAGRDLAPTLHPGDVVALSGDLGAGKTHFSKGVVEGLGGNDEVTSPTFSLVHEYLSGRLPVFHFDFYRLESEGELLALGWDDYLDERGVILAEWASKFPEILPSGTIRIEIAVEEDGSHTVKRL